MTLSAARASAYLPDAALLAAAEVALELHMPLLLSGEPGTGKTTFADYLAAELAPRWLWQQGRSDGQPLPLYAFETKSNSIASDLFYRFDHLRRFHASHDLTQSRDNRDYLTFEALGKAIMFTLPHAEIADILPNASEHPGVGRSVVLIDEIDKAPRDFPNDFLNELERLYFRIPELQQPGTRSVREVRADSALRPLLVLTSNIERNLPAAFLRRCVFHHIEFPKADELDRMRQIIEKNLIVGQEYLPAGQLATMREALLGRLGTEALAFFFAVREITNLDKLPTTAELVQWVRVLTGRNWVGLPANVKLGDLTLAQLPLQGLQATLGVLAKTEPDLRKVRGALERYLASGR